MDGAEMVEAVNLSPELEAVLAQLSDIASLDSNADTAELLHKAVDDVRDLAKAVELADEALLPLNEFESYDLAIDYEAHRQSMRAKLGEV